MAYVIKRTDQSGGYVSRPGLKESYTKNIEKIRVFATMEDAQRERCVEDEVVVPMDEI